MSALTTEMLNKLVHLDAEKRANYLFKQLAANKMLWILTDEHGCVMLNSEDEDCVPVWPHEELAQMWATGEWADCKPVSLSLKEWQHKWLSGLEQDELAIAVFPDHEGEGLVLFSNEFEFEFNQA